MFVQTVALFSTFVHSLSLSLSLNSVPKGHWKPPWGSFINTHRTRKDFWTIVILSTHTHTYKFTHTHTHTHTNTHTGAQTTHTDKIIERMLEVQEERPAAAGTAATHFNKKERGKKEREEAKDARGNLSNIGNPVPGSRNVRAKAPLTHAGSPHQLITPPCSVVLGAPSMHSNRLKNSPSANTQRWVTAHTDHLGCS